MIIKINGVVYKDKKQVDDQVIKLIEKNEIKQLRKKIRVSKVVSLDEWKRVKGIVA